MRDCDEGRRLQTSLRKKKFFIGCVCSPPAVSGVDRPVVHREPDARTVIRVRGTPADRGCKRVLEKREGFLRAVCSPPRAALLQAVPCSRGPKGHQASAVAPRRATSPPAPDARVPRARNRWERREGRATRLERSRDGPLMHRKTETGAATRSGRGPTSAMTHGLARDDHPDRLPRDEGLPSMLKPDQPEDSRMCNLPRAPPIVTLIRYVPTLPLDKCPIARPSRQVYGTYVDGPCSVSRTAGSASCGQAPGRIPGR